MHTQAHQSLLQWYAQQGRKDLPWRNLKKHIAPYGVYISEVMLQQTQVTTVLGYFERFLEKFPTFKDLSRGSEDEVLVLWRGLGYYSRAKNLLKSAKQTQGILPDSLEALKALPGIGDYTAGAILCFGFGKKVSFFDTNIKRFLLRFFALDNPTSKNIEESAQRFLNTKDSFNHNQALLDLGALICIAKNPRCNICPMQAFCKGKEKPHLYTQKKSLQYQEKQIFLGIYTEGNAIAMQKQNGFYCLVQCKGHKLLGSFKHSITRYKIQVFVYQLSQKPKDITMIHKSLLPQMPMSGLTLKALKIAYLF